MLGNFASFAWDQGKHVLYAQSDILALKLLSESWQRAFGVQIDDDKPTPLPIL